LAASGHQSMKGLVKQLKGAVVALSIGAISFFAVPDHWSARAKALASLAVAAGFWASLLLLAWLVPRLFNALAVRVVQAFVQALKQWAEKNRGVTGTDTTWNWLTDQLLVAQKRYAFSVSCIAFTRTASGIECLLSKKTAGSFGEHPVWIWPGGRYRGSSGSVEKDLERLVLEETGVGVTLLPGPGTLVRNGGFAERITTFNPETGSNDIQNEIVGSPLIVMQQNRMQRYEVPGHIDLIYLGEVQGENVTPREEAQFFHLNTLSKMNQRALWPDTRECIERAAQEFVKIIQVRDRREGGGTVGTPPPRSPVEPPS
jgi:hypothetical protein